MLQWVITATMGVLILILLGWVGRVTVSLREVTTQMILMHQDQRPEDTERAAFLPLVSAPESTLTDVAPAVVFHPCVFHGRDGTFMAGTVRLRGGQPPSTARPRMGFYTLSGMDDEGRYIYRHDHGRQRGVA